jgi:hypothetical protein
MVQKEGMGRIVFSESWRYPSGVYLELLEACIQCIVFLGWAGQGITQSKVGYFRLSIGVVRSLD